MTLATRLRKRRDIIANELAYSEYNEYSTKYSSESLERLRKVHKEYDKAFNSIFLAEQELKQIPKDDAKKFDDATIKLLKEGPGFLQLGICILIVGIITLLPFGPNNPFKTYVPFDSVFRIVIFGASLFCLWIGKAEVRISTGWR
ncbi:MAG: hypothetical protein AABW88_02635 [Nanoarchaeota archaeon]